MEKLVYVEEARKNEIVAAAIEQKMPVVISGRCPAGWRPYKSKFRFGGAVVGRLLLAPPQRTGDEDPRSFVPGERVGVTFRRGHKKCMFSTIVLGQGPVELGEPGSAVECVELQWPQALQELQRRVYYRAAPPGRRVHVRFWPGGVRKRAEAEHGSRGVLSGILMDLSAGGMRIMTTEVSADTFVEGDTIGCAFAPKPRGQTLVLDAVFRHLQAEENGAYSVGAQFVGLETSERGRKTLAGLATIVTDYQRGQARQARTRLVGRMAR